MKSDYVLTVSETDSFYTKQFLTDYITITQIRDS